jgi:hypothetical protein
MFKIEDAQIPRHFYSAVSPKGGSRAIYPFPILEPGQSFLVPADRAKSAGDAANAFKRNHPGWDYCSQPEQDGRRFFRIA